MSLFAESLGGGIVAKAMREAPNRVKKRFMPMAITEDNITDDIFVMEAR